MYRRVAAAALLCFAAACSGRPADDRVVIRFLEAPDTGGGWAEIVRRFEARHPGVEVDLVEGPPATNTREEMYAAAFLGGEPAYDLAYLDAIWVAKFAAQGWLRPLDDWFPPDARAEFLPADVEASRFEGRLYRIPMQTDAGVLYYRADLVPEVPATFEDLVRLARAAQSPPHVWGFVFQGLQYEGLVCTFLEVLWGHGGDVFDGRGNVVLDRPEAIRALEWLSGLVGRIAPPAVTTYQEEEARHAFEQGRAVFMRNWPYAWTAMQQSDRMRGRIGIGRLVAAPGAARAAVLGGWGFAVAARTRHPEEAWAFAEFATRADQQKVLHFRNGRIPSRRALFADPEILGRSPFYGELLDILLTARPRPVHPQYARISDIIQAHVSAALAGSETPEQALREAADHVRAVVRP